MSTDDHRVPDDALPSVSVDELAAHLASGADIQLIDARPRHYFAQSPDMMAGAEWRDGERVDEWAAELRPDAPAFVYCVHGTTAGKAVTAALRERGIDARYIRGGLTAWYASGGARSPKPASG